MVEDDKVVRPRERTRIETVVGDFLEQMDEHDEAAYELFDHQLEIEDGRHER